MKKLLLTLIVLFAATAYADDVGRVKLTLPTGEWTTLYTKDTALVYTGGSHGQLASKKTARALLNKDKNLLALVFIEGGGHGTAHSTGMTYNDGCKKNTNEYLFDETRGSFSALDCLRVWRSVSTEPWIKRMDDVYPELIKQGVKFEPNSFLVAHRVGTSNGTYSVVSALITHSTLKNIPEAAQGAKYAGMPGVAWGHQFALAARKSVSSFSAELVVPQIDYR